MKTKKKYIGNGVQYFVYDMGSKKVFKKKTSFFKKIKIFHNRRPNIKIISLIRYAYNATKDTRLTKSFVLKNKEIAHLFGNPHYPNKFFRKYDYIQDKVIPLNIYLQKNSSEKNKTALKQYITFLINGRKYGFSDKIFNFDRNCGTSDKNVIIMFDFCELSFCKDEVKKLIEEKYRLKKESYKDLSEELKIFFENEMNRYITLDNLEENWKCKK